MHPFYKNFKCALVSFLFLVFSGSVYLVRAEVPEGFDVRYYDGIEVSGAGLQDEPEIISAENAVKIPIIIYHSVRPYFPEDELQDRYDITPELFEQQLIYLRDHGYKTITLDDLVEYVGNGTTSPVSRPVILTFDDGWRNEYINAFPLLKKYNMTGTFYVFTNPISKKDHFMTWDHIREMDGAGMTIGSHTITHPYMKQLGGAELKHEIGESKKILERELGKPVKHFASPFGDTSPEIVNAIREAGYVTGRTTYSGRYHSKYDLLKLSGYMVNDSLADFIAILKR